MQLFHMPVNVWSSHITVWVTFLCRMNFILKVCPSWHSTYHVYNISSMKKELIADHNLHFNVWWYTRPLDYISNLIWKQESAKSHLPNLSSVPLATNLYIVKVVFLYCSMSGCFAVSNIASTHNTSLGQCQAQCMVSTYFGYKVFMHDSHIKLK